jgi:hypothetical protein
MGLFIMEILDAELAIYISKFVYDADMFELNTNFGPLCKEYENKSNSLEGAQKTFEIIYNWI